MRTLCPKQSWRTKGYDFEAFVDAIQGIGAEAVIPSKRNRLHPRALDLHLYKVRDLVERFFLKLKHFHRIATRYERLLGTTSRR